MLPIDYSNILAFCSIRPDRRYARRPLSAHLLRRMSWLLHEDFGEPTSWVAPHPFYAHLPVLPGGGLAVTVPFPSAVHSREALRRHTAVAERFDFFHDPRANLLSFAGSQRFVRQGGGGAPVPGPPDFARGAEVQPVE